VNANTFQVWGQKETAQGEQALPLNLGILYMDNETNHRWVMRFDDPKQLARSTRCLLQSSRAAAAGNQRANRSSTRSSVTK